MIEVRNLSVAYGEFRALDSLSITLPSDSIVGLIGPNGAGKSTLFSVISGFSRSVMGDVAFAGQALDKLSAFERSRLGLCRTFQIPREFCHLTVLQNLLAAPRDQAGESLWSLLAHPQNPEPPAGAARTAVDVRHRPRRARPAPDGGAVPARTPRRRTDRWQSAPPPRSRP